MLNVSAISSLSNSSFFFFTIVKLGRERERQRIPKDQRTIKTFPFDFSLLFWKCLTVNAPKNS